VSIRRRFQPGTHDLPDDCDGLPAQRHQAWLRPSGLPIRNRILIHADCASQIHLPPAAGTAVPSEPIGEGSARVSRRSQSEL